jgi:hypothetical protein
MRDQFYDGLQIQLHDNFFLCVPAFREYPVAAEKSNWGRIRALYQSDGEN